MVTSVHSDGEEDQLQGSELGEDGYWPALDILNERKHDYLVNWDGIDPETGKPWAPSWTRKSEVTEDLIEAWEAKKAAKKNNRRGRGNLKKSRATAAPASRKPGDSSSRSSKTPLVVSGRTESPETSITSDNGSRISGEPSLGKRKRRDTKHTPADEDPKPAPKKQRVDITSSSASQKPRLKPRSPKRISRETIHEEEGDEDIIEEAVLDRVSHSPSPPKAGSGSAVVRIGPPRRRKKITALPPIATLPSSPTSSSAFVHLREEEEENTQEAAGIVRHLDSSPPAVKKKKRRLKPTSDAHPKFPVFAERKPLVSPPREVTQEPRELSDQEEPPLPDQDDESTPPRSARQQMSPGSPVGEEISTPAPARAKKSTKRSGPTPKLDPYFEPLLLVADTTSVIDEFSPVKSFPSHDPIETSIRDSQVDRDATKARQPSLDPETADDPLDFDITENMQDVQDAYFDFDDRVTENGVPDQEQPTTDPGSTEKDPRQSQSPSEPVNGSVPVQSFNSQNLEGALNLLNQKSEEIEVLESRLAAQEAQIEHLQAENYRVQVECEKLSVTQEVQREALEEAKGTVSELGVHIDWLQDSLDKSEAKVKQLQGETDEIRDALDAKVEDHNLAQMEWEEERTALEERLASCGDGLSQQPAADWELEKKELEDRVVEVTEERDQLDKDKRYAENEVVSWKEQYRKEFMHSQELRQEAKDAKTEANRVQEENAIVASQTKEAVRLVTLKCEAVVEKLKTELAKAESLYKVLQVKDEKTGDNLRRRAITVVGLQDKVRQLREEVAKQAARVAEAKSGKYTCHFSANGEPTCDQVFDSPTDLWIHVVDHKPPRGQR